MAARKKQCELTPAAEREARLEQIVADRREALAGLMELSLQRIREALSAVDKDGAPDHRRRLDAAVLVREQVDRALAARSRQAVSDGGGGLVYIEELERRRAMWRASGGSGNE